MFNFSDMNSFLSNLLTDLRSVLMFLIILSHFLCHCGFTLHDSKENHSFSNMVSFLHDFSTHLRSVLKFHAGWFICSSQCELHASSIICCFSHSVSFIISDFTLFM